MLTFYQLKPALQNCLRPWVRRLAQHQVTPNHITGIAILLSLVMCTAMACWGTVSDRLPGHWIVLALPIVLLLRLSLNAIDGMLAREYHRTTALGCILNEAGDVVSDAALYLPFCRLHPPAAPVIVLIVLLASLTELVGVLGQAISGIRRYEGPMGKSDRAFVFGAVAIALGVGLPPTGWLMILWIGVIGLQLVTLVQRVRATVQEATQCG
jgi:CDP-diacylglycerol--glycerol-3-phosphate 3-phosphatidyltransferase